MSPNASYSVSNIANLRESLSPQAQFLAPPLLPRPAWIAETSQLPSRRAFSSGPLPIHTGLEMLPLMGGLCCSLLLPPSLTVQLPFCPHCLSCSFHGYMCGSFILQQDALSPNSAILTHAFVKVAFSAAGKCPPFLPWSAPLPLPVVSAPECPPPTPQPLPVARSLFLAPFASCDPAHFNT